MQHRAVAVFDFECSSNICSVRDCYLACMRCIIYNRRSEGTNTSHTEQALEATVGSYPHRSEILLTDLGSADGDKSIAGVVEIANRIGLGRSSKGRPAAEMVACAAVPMVSAVAKRATIVANAKPEVVYRNSDSFCVTLISLSVNIFIDICLSFVSCPCQPRTRETLIGFCGRRLI
jgi:hypothetical protein